MGLYRCAACGSPNVMIDTQAGGIKYNYLKGAVGTVLLGVGGAAAGIGSQQQTVYKCPDCGMVLTYPMSEALADLIDIGVINRRLHRFLDEAKHLCLHYGLLPLLFLLAFAVCVNPHLIFTSLVKMIWGTASSSCS